MKFSATIVTAIFAGAAVAVPASTVLPALPAPPGLEQADDYNACPGIYSTLQCCSADIGSIANLDCSSPPLLPNSPNDFKRICADNGKRARCCVLSAAGLAILCQNPPGV